MMGRVLQTGHVEAPPEKAFALAIDVARTPAWNSSSIEATDITGPLSQVCSIYVSVLRLASRRLECRWEVSRVERPRLLEFTGTAPGGGKATAKNRFESADAGTDVTIEVDYELPGGIVGGIADKLFVERAIERDFKHSMENFKAICEAEIHVPA